MFPQKDTHTCRLDNVWFKIRFETLQNVHQALQLEVSARDFAFLHLVQGCKSFFCGIFKGDD